MGNKDKRQENKVQTLKEYLNIHFLLVKKIPSTSGGKAIISGVFNGDRWFFSRASQNYRRHVLKLGTE